MAEQQSKGTKTLLIILIAVVVVLIVGVTAFAAYYVKNNKQEAKEEEKRQVLITEENAEQEVEKILEEEENKPAGVPSSYDVVMTTTWHFPDGESPSSDAYVENAKENQTDVYFDLRLTDTQETIYESPVIPLGGKLDEIKLSRILDPGTYDCELTYHLVDGEQNTLGTIDVVVTVIIEN